MGKSEKKELVPFTQDHVKDRKLVIEMLKKEEGIAKGPIGQGMYQNPQNHPLITLNVEHAINRITLAEFGFDTSDESVANYRTVFKTYFRSPDDYDKEVINSSYYMRNNRCVFYKAPELKKGDILPDISLYEIDGKSLTSVHREINEEDRYTVVAAFSMS